MTLRNLRAATWGGFLYGALVFGGVLSFEHVVYNRIDSARDSLIVLAVFFLLYGLWAASFFAAAWLARAALRAVRRRPAGDGWDDRERGGEAWLPGLALFTLVFWEAFFLYGLTYDQAPFGHPSGRWGMLGVLAVLGLALAAAAFLLFYLQARIARALGSRRLGRLASGAALLLVLLHALAPAFLGRSRSAPEAAGAKAAAKRSPAPPLPPVVRQPTGLKVVVVGLDGADWRVLRPLMVKGELPAFSRSVAEGASADLRSLPDSNSAVIWASIYTGMTPERHGSLDFYRIAFPGMRSQGLFPIHRTFFKELADLVSPLGLTRQIPVGRFSLSDAPYWEIADRFGASIGVVDGYFYSFPALRVQSPESYFFTYWLNGVAERASSQMELFLQPKTLFRELRPLLAGDDFAWQSAVLADRLARAPQPDLVNFYTHEPDTVQHWNWKWYEPGKYFGVRAGDLAERGDRIQAMQRSFDAFLDRLEKAVGPETVIVVASDHGHSPTFVHSHYSQHRHGPPGILLLRGGPVKKGVQLAAGVYDVFPTVLYLLGLPVPRDAAGKVLTEALDPGFLRLHPIRTIPSYRPYGPSPGLPGAVRDGAMNQAEIEKLRSLGYL
jgi:hypothetical protein